MSQHPTDTAQRPGRPGTTFATPTPPPVVVGVDGTASGQLALRWAVREATVRSLPLRLVVVAGPPLATLYPRRPLHAWETTGRQDVASVYRTDRDFESAMAYAAERLPADTVTGLHTPGEDPARVLIDEARQAEMLVVGSRGRSALGAALLGSVSASVAAHATRPVVVVRPTAPADAERTVVVGVDGSSAASQAVEFAFTEAAARGLPLTIVHCWPEVAPERPVSFDSLFPGLWRRLHELHRRLPDVDVRTSLLAGDPGTRLAEQSHGAELIVVGSRGRGRVTGLLLGSVSQNLLHHADCPVAVVHPG